MAKPKRLKIGRLRIFLSYFKKEWNAYALELDCDETAKTREAALTKLLQSLPACVEEYTKDNDPGFSYARTVHPDAWDLFYHALRSDRLFFLRSVEFQFPDQLPFEGIDIYVEARR